MIAIIRNSDDVAAARSRLIEVFELSEIQANYILDMPLRRLTRFSRIELESERDAADRPDRRADRDPGQPRAAARGGQRGSWPRSPSSTAPPGGPSCSRPAEWSPRRPRPRWRWPTTRAGCCCPRPGCWPGPTTPTRSRPRGPRANHDVIVSRILATARADCGLVTCAGRLIKINALDLPTRAGDGQRPQPAGRHPRQRAGQPRAGRAGAVPDHAGARTRWVWRSAPPTGW